MTPNETALREALRLHDDLARLDEKSGDDTLWTEGYREANEATRAALVASSPSTAGEREPRPDWALRAAQEIADAYNAVTIESGDARMSASSVRIMAQIIENHGRPTAASPPAPVSNDGGRDTEPKNDLVLRLKFSAVACEHEDRANLLSEAAQFIERACITPPSSSRAQAIEEAVRRTLQVLAVVSNGLRGHHATRLDMAQHLTAEIDVLQTALRTTAPATAKPDDAFVPCGMYEIGMDPSTGDPLRPATGEGDGKGWQPIETAPKDETWIILFLPDRSMAGDEPKLVRAFWSAGGDPGWYESEASSNPITAFGDEPTHWMHDLPLPLASDQQKPGGG